MTPEQKMWAHAIRLAIKDIIDGFNFMATQTTTGDGLDAAERRRISSHKKNLNSAFDFIFSDQHTIHGGILAAEILDAVCDRGVIRSMATNVANDELCDSARLKFNHRLSCQSR